MNRKVLVDLDFLKTISEKKNHDYVLSNEGAWSNDLNLLQKLILTSNNELVKDILKNNIDFFKEEIDYQNGIGWTALIMACINSNTYSNDEIVELLLKNNADPNLKDNNGQTALMYACRYSNTNSNIKTVKLLLEYGADLHLKVNREWNTLMLACRNSSSYSNTETVKLLLEYGADPNLKTTDGWTALMLSCANLNVNTVKLLLNQNNIDINIKTIDTKCNASTILYQSNPNRRETLKLFKLK